MGITNPLWVDKRRYYTEAIDKGKLPSATILGVVIREEIRPPEEYSTEYTFGSLEKFSVVLKAIIDGRIHPVSEDSEISKGDYVFYLNAEAENKNVTGKNGQMGTADRLKIIHVGRIVNYCPYNFTVRSKRVGTKFVIDHNVQLPPIKEIYWVDVDFYKEKEIKALLKTKS